MHQFFGQFDKTGHTKPCRGGTCASRESDAFVVAFGLVQQTREIELNTGDPPSCRHRFGAGNGHAELRFGSVVITNFVLEEAEVTSYRPDGAEVHVGNAAPVRRK